MSVTAAIFTVVGLRGCASRGSRAAFLRHGRGYGGRGDRADTGIMATGGLCRLLLNMVALLGGGAAIFGKPCARIDARLERVAPGLTDIGVTTTKAKRKVHLMRFQIGAKRCSADRTMRVVASPADVRLAPPAPPRCPLWHERPRQPRTASGSRNASGE